MILILTYFAQLLQRMLTGKLVTINVFDDGARDMGQYDNLWVITDTKFHGSKIALSNISNNNIKIPSISTWKVKFIDSELEQQSCNLKQEDAHPD